MGIMSASSTISSVNSPSQDSQQTRIEAESCSPTAKSDVKVVQLKGARPLLSTPPIKSLMTPGSPPSSSKRITLSPGGGLSELSKQLRILQTKNESQRIEIDRLERQLKILADLQGISVSELRNALQIACQSEAYNELQSRVAYLRSQLEEASLLNSSKREHHGSQEDKQLLKQIESLNHQIATLQLRVGELEELDEKKKEQIKSLYQQLINEKERSSNLEAKLQSSADSLVEVQRKSEAETQPLALDETLLHESKREIALLREKLALIEQQLHASEEECKLRVSQYKARFYVQDERIVDLEQQLSSLYTAFTLMSQERNEELKQERILKENLTSADEEVAKQAQAANNRERRGGDLSRQSTGYDSATKMNSSHTNIDRQDTSRNSLYKSDDFETPQKETASKSDSNNEKRIQNKIDTPNAVSARAMEPSKSYDSNYIIQTGSGVDRKKVDATQPSQVRANFSDSFIHPIQNDNIMAASRGTNQSRESPPRHFAATTGSPSSDARQLAPSNHSSSSRCSSTTLLATSLADEPAPFAESIVLPSNPLKSYSNGDCVISGTLILRSVNSIGIRKWKRHTTRLIAYDSHYQLEVIPPDSKKAVRKYYSIHKNISIIERYTKHDNGFVLHVNFIDNMSPVLYCAAEDKESYKKWLSALSLATTTRTSSGSPVEVELEILDAVNGPMPTQNGLKCLQQGSIDAIGTRLSPEEQEAADLARALEASVNDFSMSHSETNELFDSLGRFDATKKDADTDQSV